jgi:hypothetical protein
MIHARLLKKCITARKAALSTRWKYGEFNWNGVRWRLNYLNNRTWEILGRSPDWTIHSIRTPSKHHLSLPWLARAISERIDDIDTQTVLED